MDSKKALRTTVLLLGLILIAPVAALANSPAPDLILIPIVASHARDATGAVWSSTVFFNYTQLDFALSVANNPVLDFRDLQPGEHGVLDMHANKLLVGPGAIIITFASASKQLSIQSYVYNEAKPGVGVSIPGIRASDLLVGQSVRLIGVPLNVDSRTLVRIYSMANGIDADVLVRVLDPYGHELSVNVVHLFSTPVLPRHADAAQPAYGEYQPPLDPAKYPSISIDIEPLTPATNESPFSAKIWAFSTTTGPHSENVTAVFPAR
jgi:hypothetical protein